MNIEPYLPALTALFTLLNTLVLVWNHRKVRHLSEKVNGMYLQTLADAESRGRQLGKLAATVAPGAAAARTVPPGT